MLKVRLRATLLSQLLPRQCCRTVYGSAHRTLGLGPEASLDQIHKAYKALALQHHPDTGGSASRFVEIQRAFEDARRSVLEHRPEGHAAESTRSPLLSKSALLDRIEHLLFDLEILEEELRERRREARCLGAEWRDACTPQHDDWEARSVARQEVFGPMMDLEQQVQEVAAHVAITRCSLV